MDMQELPIMIPMSNTAFRTKQKVYRALGYYFPVNSVMIVHGEVDFKRLVLKTPQVFNQAVIIHTCLPMQNFDFAMRHGQPEIAEKILWKNWSKSVWTTYFWERSQMFLNTIPLSKAYPQFYNTIPSI